MIDDPYKAWNLQETAVQRALRDLQPLRSFIDQQNELTRYSELSRGIADEIERADQLIDHAGIDSLIAQSSLVSTEAQSIAERFHLPEMQALAELRNSLLEPTIVDAMARYGLEANNIGNAMAEMGAPW